MYDIIDWLFTILSLFITFFIPIYYEAAYLFLVGIAFYILYPLIMEPIYNLISSYDQSYHSKLHRHQGTPILYNSNYNITACGIEKMHPFDSCKYERVYQKLIQELVITDKLIYTPPICSRALMISLGMSRIYLLKLCYSIFVSRIVELPLCFLPAPFLRSRLLNPMLYATQGTIDGCCLAVEKGWAINIGGGYHHASLNEGGGFCVYADITLGIRHMRRYHPERKKVMIVDLDAHQGNGHERDFIGDENTFILDFYNHSIYPNDIYAKQAISEDVSVTYYDTDQEYAKKLRTIMLQSIKDFNPDFVLYNAGTDCMVNDPLGCLNLSREGIILRDSIMFELCLQFQVPILMVLSGGYQQVNAPTIADSISNILKSMKK